ncbi:hypothetical protein A3C09_00400 [Candidatus Uhrbacteria bacterium RIFCSPHIGHO2_02_FULL_47_44]|uniref:PpiC domain-containing protein n=1 Tax=Candidatus Uhrbacteria bacterium RIFCSPLOWO2_02_FULL_48_18 TaxID=1802408 RepID=A0A1F7V956_9BACT|nr:MAG: hypothetical protein A3C09_00400 [Candidatus Uhrbacteria bacterium RIFCSPHIGHO2_02_FULL_47_44]OGL76181.1 MAG: hypothetical protein A3E97_03045 [Candidatus Uhrbacteria bacterium RIFCSPHIGHO2_12_FULL_47_12]OGL81899.1 MAG: hypothetical protein A3B20_02310 [Candidatus Uhrbacteria bacterium RIFCSPLOWO2_01_FULL_47_17]OGL87062.1 MAG: hypothetical protein A3I41_03900 [Candidatus Uhrbacteria bacterium RIFCSPLOWO2_02_FULL_48_18]OGL92724.1 MAG: hypothetical protein A3H12_03595 [Candidatus Uhrbacte
MMNEQDETMVTSGSDQMPSNDDGHICTDADMCTADQPQEHLVVSTDVPVESTPVHASKRPCTRSVVLGATGAIVILVGALSAFVYSNASSHKTVHAITTRLPFPALFVGRRVVTYKQYYDEQDALKRYFASTAAAGAPAPTSEQMDALITQTLINKAVVKTLASNYGLTLDQSKIEAFYANFLASNQGQSKEVIEAELQKSFGWTIPEFKQRIIGPIVLSAQVEDYVASSEFFQKPLHDLINSAHTRVTTGAESFEEVGTAVHNQVQLNLKSDLGFIKKSELPEAWGSKVADLENGQVTEVIELPQGYAIFTVTERIKSQDSAGKKVDPKALPADEQVHLYTITVPKKTLEQVTQEYLENVSVRTWIKP